MTNGDLLKVLTRFHREVVVPDIERVVEEQISATIAPFRTEMQANFDAVFKRLDRLETEYGIIEGRGGTPRRTHDRR